MKRSKCVLVAERLAERITKGDYTVNGFPSERKLADEMGVTQKTARKAIQQIVDEGLVHRLPNGRLKVMNGGKGSKEGFKQIAFLTPEWYSPVILLLQDALLKISHSMNFTMRIVPYFHNDDPVIKNTISGFDCTFMVTSEEPAAKTIIPEIKNCRRPVISLTNDWSRQGIPSILLHNPLFMTRMLEHLNSLGHRRIDCLNVQPYISIVPENISSWKSWLSSHGLKGRLFNKPVEPGTYTLPAAYELVDRLIKEKKFDSRALVCVTSKAAIGAIRAMADNGIRAGHDVAVCTIGAIEDFPGSFEYSIPSLTSIATPDPGPFLSACIRQAKTGKWKGPLLISPENAEVAVRESTVPGIRRVS
ncbi:MAG TPA: hypothetical protein DET40_22600 [Lentisphaeria bacterium]|nr:MAG: hypothetical protein A2X45_17330 [Lentisphaerae bacterium GWF2_50_93]HCE46346.1 hypothetical protein [Lentisphaeria bacterium]